MKTANIELSEKEAMTINMAMSLSYFLLAEYEPTKNDPLPEEVKMLGASLALDIGFEYLSALLQRLVMWALDNEMIAKDRPDWWKKV